VIIPVLPHGSQVREGVVVWPLDHPVAQDSRLPALPLLQCPLWARPAEELAQPHGGGAPVVQAPLLDVLEVVGNELLDQNVLLPVVVLNEHLAVLQLVEPPGLHRVQAVHLLVPQGLGLRQVLNVVATDVPAQQHVQQVGVAARPQRVGDPAEVGSVLPVLLADVQHAEAPLLETSWHNPVLVRRHDHVQAVGRHLGVDALGLDHDRRLGHQGLEDGGMPLVPGKEGLVREQHDAVPQVRVEVSSQVLSVAHVNKVTAEQLAERTSKEAFTHTLVAPEDDGRLTRLVRHLYRAGHPVENVAVCLLVTGTDVLVDVIEQRLVLVPWHRFKGEAPPHVVGVARLSARSERDLLELPALLVLKPPFAQRAVPGIALGILADLDAPVHVFVAEVLERHLDQPVPLEDFVVVLVDDPLLAAERDDSVLVVHLHQVRVNRLEASPFDLLLGVAFSASALVQDGSADGEVRVSDDSVHDVVADVCSAAVAQEEKQCL